MGRQGPMLWYGLGNICLQKFEKIAFLTFKKLIMHKCRPKIDDNIGLKKPPMFYQNCQKVVITLTPGPESLDNNKQKLWCPIDPMSGECPGITMSIDILINLGR
jgi:hypothetical protein